MRRRSGPAIKSGDRLQPEPIPAAAAFAIGMEVLLYQLKINPMQSPRQGTRAEMAAAA